MGLTGHHAAMLRVRNLINTLARLYPKSKLYGLVKIQQDYIECLTTIFNLRIRKDATFDSNVHEQKNCTLTLPTLLNFTSIGKKINRVPIRSMSK